MSELSPMTDTDMRWLGVDLDQTIANGTGYPNFELTTPLKGAKDALVSLAKDGWKITIYTARPWADYSKIEHWLDEWKIPYRRIVCGKILVRFMIDDRNLEFRGDWTEMLDRLEGEL